MANEEHLKILAQGMVTWNAWRADNPHISPDLSQTEFSTPNFSLANLCNANLAHAQLDDANLRYADLQGANLTAAHLSGADLLSANLAGAVLDAAAVPRARFEEANLTEASLSVALLIGTDFSNANLDRAKLTRAALLRANLTGALVAGADFSDSVMGATALGAIDLSGGKGLESVRHVAPSTVGIDTLYLSKGMIPEVFLRGCGVPDDFITYMRSLVAHPIEYYSCFISYSGQDEEFAKRLYADLQSEHVRCWFAPEDLKIGEKIRSGIDEAIRVHDKLLLVLSRNSVQSQWVEKEVETALEKERQQNRLVLFPIRLDDAVMETGAAWAADIRRTRNIGDFRQWKDPDQYKNAFERLLRDLKSEFCLTIQTLEGANEK